jgi:hypothetical protein
MTQAINDLAQSLVPELGKVTLQHVSERNIEIEGFTPEFTPLPDLPLGPKDQFQPLLDSGANGEVSVEWSPSERAVFTMLKHQKACVKTIKNSEWKSFLNRFLTPQEKSTKRFHTVHDDIAPHDNFSFNSYVTSTSLLPELGMKMRCYGSVASYNTGVVFALPDKHKNGNESEDEAARKSQTWSWPAGYAAKTEFNIDDHGRLINGRQEALVPLSQMRQFNHDYIHKKDYMIAGRLVKGGYNIIPYNEIFLRVGGTAVSLTQELNSNYLLPKNIKPRSFDLGVGLPVALFIRTNTMEDMVALFRNRARMGSILGEEYVREIPLLFISNELGVRVFTKKLQASFWSLASERLNPFQNHALEPLTTIHNTDEQCIKQKTEELLHFDEHLRGTLTPAMLAKIAGGFGMQDMTVAAILEDVMKSNAMRDQKYAKVLQSVVFDAFAASVRSGDYHLARQILIIYSIVGSNSRSKAKKGMTTLRTDSAFTYVDTTILRSMEKASEPNVFLPPPINTDMLRCATHSDGLLVVFGATQILKSLQDGNAKQRTEESFTTVEEWVEHAEQSVAFRLASWREQRAAEEPVALTENAKMMAFVSNKAITNRKEFACNLRKAIPIVFNPILFLQVISDIISSMHAPCLRLELLQYILGLDSRYSVYHVKESIDLAATCIYVSS